MTEIEQAVKAEVEAITKWLRSHGMRQIANSIERGDHIERTDHAEG